MDYIDELYAHMLATQGRRPANAAFDQVLRTGVPAPAGTPLVGSSPAAKTPELEAYKPTPQKEIVIEANRPELIEYPPGYKVQVPQSEIIRQNYNEAYSGQIQDAQNLAASADELYSERAGQKTQMQDALKRMMEISSKTYSDPESDAAIKLYKSKYSDAPEIPGRDLLTESILSLGPALGAMFMGESGALAAPVAMKGARDTYEMVIKSEIDRIKAMREDTEKRLKAAIEAKKSGQESFDKAQQRELDRDKAVLSGTKDISQMTADELKSVEQNIVNINKDVSAARANGATDVAKMERSKWESEQKTKRASKFAKPLKAGEVAGVGDPLPGFTWNQKTPFSQGDLSKLQSAASDRETLKSLLSKVADKVQNATKLELSNPASGVRRSIESDLADAQLLYKGESFANLGVLTGPDVSYLDKVLDPPSFANAVMRGGSDEALKRYASAVDRINERFNSKLKFKGFTPNKPLEGINLPPKKEFKEIKGEKYEKVPGGWKKVK